MKMKKQLNEILRINWILIQLVIQLIPTLVNRIVVYVTKTRTLKVKLDLSILIISSVENVLLSLLKNTNLIFLKIFK